MERERELVLFMEKISIDASCFEGSVEVYRECEWGGREIEREILFFPRGSDNFFFFSERTAAHLWHDAAFDGLRTESKPQKLGCDITVTDYR